MSKDEIPATVPVDVREIARTAFAEENKRASHTGEAVDPIRCITDAIMRYRASRPDTPAVEGEWVTVPREPTDKMVIAAVRIDLSNMPDQQGPDRAGVYRAMIAAAPHPAPTQDVSDLVRRGIYIASKVKHAARWRILRDKVGFPVVSTWIDEADAGQSQDLTDLWRRCIAEASGAEVLIFNAEQGELFKGAWAELGAALANRVPVLAVGLDKIDGLTLAHAPGVRHFNTMAEVTALLKPMINGARFDTLTSAGSGE